MIRVKKTSEVPQSLTVTNCNQYDGEDVKEQLYKDQLGKCYLCEEETKQNFQIDHLKPKVNFPQLKYIWENLFLSCPYCNGIKSNNFEKLFDPSKHNTEHLIEQRIRTNKVLFINNDNSESSTQTISLLDKLLNGKSGLRDLKCKILFDSLLSELNIFMQILEQHQKSPTEETRETIITSLDQNKQFLGFKYWIIKDNNALHVEFKDFMVWNKV